jgi:hypothetical protein
MKIEVRHLNLVDMYRINVEDFIVKPNYEVDIYAEGWCLVELLKTMTLRYYNPNNGDLIKEVKAGDIVNPEVKNIVTNAFNQYVLREMYND